MSDDLIYRQAAIDAMINSRSNADVTLVPGSYTNGWRDGRKLLLDELLQVVFELPSAQPDVPDTNVGDMISRQSAIEEIARWIGYIDEDMILRIQTGLKKVPSAQRKGKWIDVNGDGSLYECDQCHDLSCCVGNYCMECGARMEVE